MKKALNIGTIIWLLVCAAACNDSFLDTTATDTYNENNFWKTEVHALAAINACYAVTRNGNMYGGQNLWMENYTPNSYSSGGNIPLATGTHNSTNVSLFQSRWEVNFQGIGRVNGVLANIDQVQMDQGLKQRIKGEALFLRALFYADLVNYYGSAPLILEAPNFQKHKALPRNPRTEIIAQVLSDLEQAAAILPLTYSGPNKGRATKGAALGLKTRVLLYEQRWQEAADAAKAVMDLNLYHLFPDYRGLFMLENEGNAEVVFDVQFLEPLFTNAYDVYLELQMSLAPTLELVNSYQMVDGLPINQSPLYNPAQPFENRDPRLHQTIVVPGYMFKGGIVNEAKYFSTGFGFKKYTSYKDEVKTPNLIRSQINYMVLRYADILLMYAEARNEASGNDASVAEALNQVRKRAGMPEVPAGLSQEEMRALIRHERRIELAGEGLYYDDIRRWRTAEIVNNGAVHNKKGEVVQTRAFDPRRDYLWPIHAVTLQENPNLGQNPNYNQ